MVVTYLFIAVNVAVFLSLRFKMIPTAGVTLYAPAVFGEKQYSRLITAGFSHQHPLHLLMNMLSLYSIGRILEPWFGSALFCLLYLLTMVTGGFFTCLFRKDEPVQSLGASIAVFGVSGVYGVALFAFAGAGTGLAEIGRTLLSLVVMTRFRNIDNLGHLCGFFAGVFYALILCGMCL